MPNVGLAVKGIVGRALPASTADGQETEVRLGRYGSQIVESIGTPKQIVSDEGQYFIATNPTIGTAVTNALTTAFSATAPIFAIKNNDSASSSGKRIFMDYVRFIEDAGTAPTATVSLHFAVRTDPKDMTPTAGNQAITPVNVNADSLVGTIANVQAFNAANLTVPAAGPSVRTVGRASIPVGQVVIGDEYVLDFGPTDLPATWGGLTAARATMPGRFVTHMPPVVLGPQQWLLIYRWCLTEATNAPQYEFELAWWER